MNAAINWLSTIADAGVSGLMLWSWQSFVLLTLVWLFLKVARVKSPVHRYHIWLFSLIALAALPLATQLAHRLPAVRPANSTWNQVVEAPRRVVNFAVVPSKVSQPTTTPKKAEGQPAIVLPRTLLFVVWITGVLLGLTRLSRSRIKWRLLRRRARVISPCELDLPAYTTKIRLRASSEVDAPVLCGILRPVILVPADLAEWTTPSERNAMIHHELAHVERLDPLANFFQNALRIVFFFHPLIRYACHQLSVERELACDERVIALGTCAESYAEGLLKAAERGLGPRVRYQLAFFSTRQTLERRIEMILNSDRTRAGARNWKFVIFSSVIIALAAWLLIPAGVAIPVQSQTSGESRAKMQIVKEMGERKAFDDLIEMALHNLDPEMRRLAVVQLTELEGDGSTQAMVDLYNKTDDFQVRIMVIDTLARISEIEPLTRIASSTQDPEEKQRVLRRIKFLKQTSESNDVRNFDVSALGEELNRVSAEPPPPPPPPPPSRRTPPPPPPPRRTTSSRGV
jgi:beta-lactamase regulating signal transducer with metallopeptidase domain